MMKKLDYIYLALFLLVIGCQDSKAPTNGNNGLVCDFPMPEPVQFPIAKIETRLGIMHFWLFDETPQHKAKFIELANFEYYNDFTFNRVIEDFVIQGGCPDSPAYFEGSRFLLDPEFIDTIGHVYGALGMGRDDNPDKQSNACQFYVISNEEGVPRLDGDYTVFGEIIDGKDVLEAIQTTTTDSLDQPNFEIPLTVSIEEYGTIELEETFGYVVP